VRVRVPASVEVCFSRRPFTRRRRWRFLRIASAARLTLPAYIFKAVPIGFRTRSVLRSRPRSAFLHSGERSSRATRCPIPRSEPAVGSRAFTPLQDLSILPAHSAPPGSGKKYIRKSPSNSFRRKNPKIKNGSIKIHSDIWTNLMLCYLVSRSLVR
jgi:hypothetical protein